MYLYFIDAEVYQTKTSFNIESAYQELKEQGCLEEDDNSKERIGYYRNLVNAAPNRLILFDTEMFKIFFLAKKLNRPYKFKNILLRQVQIQGGSTLLEHHIARLAQFLHINDFIDLENDMSVSEITRAVSNAFGAENAINLVERELDASREVETDVPVFYFHIKRGMIQFPIIGEKLLLKKKEKTTDEN